MTVDATTQELFDRLPGYMRDADEQQGDRPLLSYLSLAGGELDRPAVIAARLDLRAADPDALVPSELADPLLADPVWLPWLAQGVGVDLSVASDVALRRDLIRLAPAGWRRGSKTAIADAARSALTGNRYVRVYDHSATAVGDGGPFDLLIVTRDSETPDSASVLAAVVTAKAKPAGATLHHATASATYAQTQAASTPDTYAGRLAVFPTYRDAFTYLPEA